MKSSQLLDMRNKSSATFARYIGFSTSTVGLAQAQTPLDNMDSLIEASHKRMMERQAAEHEADSLRTIEVTAAVPTQKTEEGRGWYYLLGVFGVVGVGVVLCYYRGYSKT